VQGARGAAQRTVAAGSASAGDPANPRGGEQNLGDIYRSRTMLATERERMEGEREREGGKKKNWGRRFDAVSVRFKPPII